MTRLSFRYILRVIFILVVVQIDIVVMFYMGWLHRILFAKLIIVKFNDHRIAKEIHKIIRCRGHNAPNIDLAELWRVSQSMIDSRLVNCIIFPLCFCFDQRFYWFVKD